MSSIPKKDAEPFVVDRPRITATGMTMLWMSAGALVVGVLRYDGALLWLSLAAAGIVGASRWWAPRNLSGLTVYRSRPQRVFAGEAFDTVLTLAASPEGHRWLPKVGISLEARDLSIVKEGGVLRLTNGLSRSEQASGAVRGRFFRRGWERRREGELRSRFPLGLFEVSARGEIEEVSSGDGEGMIVYPRPWLPGDLIRDLELSRFEREERLVCDPSPGSEFRGIRDFRSGDAVKTVHWSATARVGDLMVREWDPPVPRPWRLGVILHTVENGRRLLRPERWELALRLATGIVTFSRRNGIPLSFVDLTRPGREGEFRIPEPRSASALLHHLAVAMRKSTGSGEDLMAAVSRLSRQSDRLYVISDVPVSRWEEIVSGVPRAVPIVCVDPDRVLSSVAPPIPRREGRQNSVLPGTP